MKIKNVRSVIFALALLLFPGGLATAADKDMYSVLVVMSYGPDYKFNQEVQEGIESVLSQTCRIGALRGQQDPAGFHEYYPKRGRGHGRVGKQHLVFVFLSFQRNLKNQNGFQDSP
jgi:hypothetical protein